MILGLISDPSFIPVTIAFTLVALFAYWQKLNKYIIHLSIVYLAFIIVTAMSYNSFDNDAVADPYIAIEDSTDNNAILGSYSTDVTIHDYLTNTFTLTGNLGLSAQVITLSAGEFSNALTVYSQSPFYQTFQDIIFS